VTFTVEFAVVMIVVAVEGEGMWLFRWWFRLVMVEMWWLWRLLWWREKVVEGGGS
jgi:hypothetical protein